MPTVGSFIPKLLPQCCHKQRSSPWLPHDPQLQYRSGRQQYLFAFGWRYEPSHCGNTQWEIVVHGHASINFMLVQKLFMRQWHPSNVSAS